MEEYNENSIEEVETQEVEQQDYEDDNFGDEKPKRTWGLLLLCILTFIGSGLNALSYLLMPVIKPITELMKDSYDKMFTPEIAEDMVKNIEFLAQVPDWKFVLLALTYALAVVGAAFMLKLNKLGLHLYIIAQIAIFAVATFLIGGALKQDISSLVFSAMWAGLYYLQLRASGRN